MTYVSAPALSVPAWVQATMAEEPDDLYPDLLPDVPPWAVSLALRASLLPLSLRCPAELALFDLPPA